MKKGINCKDFKIGNRHISNTILENVHNILIKFMVCKTSPVAWLGGNVVPTDQEVLGSVPGSDMYGLSVCVFHCPLSISYPELSSNEIPIVFLP